LTSNFVNFDHSNISTHSIYFRNESYGCEYASFTLQNLVEFTARQHETIESIETLSKLYESNLKSNFYSNSIEYKWNLENQEEIDAFIMKYNRKFVIDLHPNLFYSQSKLINLLIQSDVSKYCEFKLIKRLLTCSFNESKLQLEQIPTSRSDIFKSKNLSMVEKRILMKFITFCVDEATPQPSLATTLGEYLDTFNLTERLRNYILNAIAMCPAGINVDEGIQRCRKYFKSIGRYGDSPFLYQIYGTNELTQAFSRLSAVFGAIFYLNLPICSIKIDQESNQVDGVVVDLPNEKEKLFKCKNLITNLNYLKYEVVGERFEVSKCVLITNKSFFNVDDETSQNEVKINTILIIFKMILIIIVGRFRFYTFLKSQNHQKFT
jgi:RAB protein geranylgeranyltransferase component A